jgi:hypothetical protein
MPCISETKSLADGRRPRRYDNEKNAGPSAPRQRRKALRGAMGSRKEKAAQAVLRHRTVLLADRIQRAGKIWK